MKTVSKYFILNLILLNTIAAYPTHAITAATIELDLREIVAKHCVELKKIKSNDANSLKLLLKKLKIDMLETINKAQDIDEYKELKEGLEALDPDSIVNILKNVKTILNNLPQDIAEIIKEHLPPLFKKFVNQ